MSNNSKVQRAICVLARIESPKANRFNFSPDFMVRALMGMGVTRRDIIQNMSVIQRHISLETINLVLRMYTNIRRKNNEINI